MIEAADLERMGIDQSASDSAEPVYYGLLRRKPELEGEVWGALAEFLGTELLDRGAVGLDGALASVVPVRLAHQHTIVPIGSERWAARNRVG